MNFTHNQVNKKTLARNKIYALLFLLGLIGHSQVLPTELLENKSDEQANVLMNSRDEISAFSSALQSDGKLVVGGTDGNNFVLARYQFNGLLDPSFNGTGIRRVSIRRSNSAKVKAVAIQPDGKILAAGTDGSNFVTARLTPEGTLDTTFNAAGEQPGVVITAIPAFTKGTASAVANAIALTPEGKILVGGTDGTNFVVASYLPSGVLDLSFNARGTQPGVVVTSIGTSTSSAANTIALDKDRKVVVGGTDGSNFVVARYLQTGILDDTFNSSGAQPGVVSTNVGSSTQSKIMGLDVQADSNIVVTGTDGMNFVVARYITEGALDQDFNAGGAQPGVFVTSFPHKSESNSAVIQANGKILSTGFSEDENGNTNFTLIRHLLGGPLDGDFGSSGVVVTSLPSSSQANHANIHVNGAIVAVGSLTTGLGEQKFVIVRYNHDGSLDRNFGDNGIVTTDISAPLTPSLKPNKKLSTFRQNLHATVIADLSTSAISGTAQNKSLVTLLIDGAAVDLGTFTDVNTSGDETDTDGNWNFEVDVMSIGKNRMQKNSNSQRVLQLTPGQHIIQATANYRAGNIIIESEPLAVCVPLITVNVIPTSEIVCLDNTITLTANVSGGAAIRYIWTTPNRGAITTLTNVLELSNAKVNDSGNYTVVAIDVNGCPSDPSNSAFVNVGPAITLTTNCNVVSPCCPITVTATASGGTPPYKFLWSDNVINLNVTEPVTRKLILDNNQISVTVTDANGCAATSIIRNALSQAIKGKYCS